MTDNRLRAAFGVALVFERYGRQVTACYPSYAKAPEAMPEPRLLSVKYETSPDRPVLAATGARGGPSPEGAAVIVHLYADYGSIPISEIHTIAEDGSVDLTKGEVTPQGELTRKVLGTLVLAPEIAISIGKWLITKGENAQQIREIQAKSASEQK